MILRHKNRELLRYEWTAMGGIRLLSVEESARRWLPLEFGEASAPGNEQALADRLASWLNHRIFDNGFGLFALGVLTEVQQGHIEV